ncbi:hypothetical protein B0A55_10538 [Friedmanniomyces simplex]|uniref:Uncharacterized protein n=1 Tax=Friedmanniomyces simplex TaxID=329884 RepID=A0A4U0WGV1_9PEZI|nr:hypothetical protein B0A55_10538 [Friedmanniomyces simplex]
MTLPSLDSDGMLVTGLGHATGTDDQDMADLVLSWDSEATTSFSAASASETVPSFGLDGMMTGLDSTFPGFWGDVDFGDTFTSLSGLTTPVSGNGTAAISVPPNAEKAMRIIECWTKSERTIPHNGESRSAFLEWCSAAPDPSIYDLDILDIWIELAITRVGGTFPLFQSFRVDENTRDELYLAVAAVGGAFCDAENSFDLARVMFNDARRLALAAPFRSDTIDVDYALSLSKTFMLIEINGLVSGDKRSFEFVEVFHIDLLQVVSHLSKSRTGPPSSSLDQELQL